MRNGRWVLPKGSSRTRAIAAIINLLVAAIMIVPLVRLPSSVVLTGRFFTGPPLFGLNALVFGLAFAIVAIGHAVAWRWRWPLQIGVIVAAVVGPPIVFADWLLRARP